LTSIRIMLYLLKVKLYFSVPSHIIVICDHFQAQKNINKLCLFIFLIS